MFDLKSVTEVESAAIDLLHPVTRQKLGATVTLAGPEHKVRKDYEFKHARKLRARMQKLRRLDLGDPEEDAEEAIERLVAFTLSWSGFAEDGKEIVFSAEAARVLYARPDMGWLRTQLLEAAEQHDFFIRSSAPA